MDWMFSKKSRVSFRYGQTPWLNYAKLVWGNNPAEPSNEYPSTRIARNWGADWTYTLSPTLVFNLRGGLARYEGFSGNTFGVELRPAAAGIPGVSLVSQFSPLMFPRFNMGTYSELGSQGGFSYSHATTPGACSPTPAGRRAGTSSNSARSCAATTTTRAARAGQRHVHLRQPLWTQANPQRADSASGNEFASFLLGYPNGGSVDRNIDPSFRSQYYCAVRAGRFQGDSAADAEPRAALGLRIAAVLSATTACCAGSRFGQASPIAAAAKASPAAANCPACAAGLTGGLHLRRLERRRSRTPSIRSA